jgi:hypothetical protein
MKSKFKAEKGARLRKAKREAADKKVYGNVPFVVEANRDCGCCTATLRFKDEASAIAAFKAAGLCNGAVIVDDAGDRHEGIDTFYGFWQEKAEGGEARGLGHLFDVVTGKRGWP